jgi:tRNA dimethylallyltransferase
VGPTAAGKSAIAEAVARRFHATIISVDSMQVYRGMDIGTAKAPVEVRTWADYRMIDVCDPIDDFTVHTFQRMARRHLEELATQYRRAIIVGGSGLHFRAVVDPMTMAPTDAVVRSELEEQSLGNLVNDLAVADPDAGKHVDLANRRRVVRALETYRLTGETPSRRASSFEAGQVRRYEPMYPFQAIGIDAGTESKRRVEARLAAMMDEGFLAEVVGLDGHLGTSASQAVGYRELTRMAGGEIRLDQAIADTLRATNALVKRQRTFFRRDPRVEWLDWHHDEQVRIESAADRVGEKMQWTS